MDRYRNAVLFVALAAIWGTALMVTKAGLAHLPPTLFAALRFDLAVVLLFGYVISTGLDWRPRTVRDWTALLAGGTFMIGGHHAFLFAGQQYVSSAVAAVLLGLVPVVTPALTRVFSSTERLSSVGTCGVILGFVGIVIIANPDPGNLVTSDSRGIVLIVVSAIVFALGAVLTHENESSLPLAASQAWMMLIGAVLLHITSGVVDNGALGSITWTTDAVLAIVYLGVVSSATGFLLYFALLERIGPIEMSCIEYVSPLFAALSDWIAFGETIGIRTALGFFVILSGFALIKHRMISVQFKRLVALPERER